jgi:hypothetical protein
MPAELIPMPEPLTELKPDPYYAKLAEILRERGLEVEHRTDRLGRLRAERLLDLRSFLA